MSHWTDDDGARVTEFGREQIAGDKPHGILQWKGTDACIDLTCTCGGDEHVDADFLYTWTCPACGKRWLLSPFVLLVEGEPE